MVSIISVVLVLVWLKTFVVVKYFGSLSSPDLKIKKDFERKNVLRD